jgi:hypothetical protein
MHSFSEHIQTHRLIVYHARALLLDGQTVFSDMPPDNPYLKSALRSRSGDSGTMVERSTPCDLVLVILFGGRVEKWRGSNRR